MINNYLKFLFLALFAFVKVQATEKPLNEKNRNEKGRPESVGSSSHTSLSEAEVKSLNDAVNKMTGSNPARYIVPDLMEDLDVQASVAVEDDRSKARKLMTFLKNNPDRITSTLDFESLMTLPVGLKKTLPDNSEVIIGIYSVTFDNNSGANAVIFCQLTTQVESADGGREKRDILFGVEGVRFTKTGGLMSNEVEAFLLGDFTIPAKNWTIKLNAAPATGPRTSIVFKCNEGFKRVNVNADIIFPRNVIVPYDIGNRVAYTTGRFSLNTTATVTNGFRDLILTTTTTTSPGGGPKAFAVAGFEKFGFILQNLVVDMSDINNSDDTVLPLNYNHPDKNSNLWRGVSLKQLKVLFPKEFENGTGSDFTVDSLIVDNTGFTGKFNYSSNTGISFKAQNWQYSVKSLEMEFLQGKFISGGFGGGFYTPINERPQNSSDVSKTGFAYKAVIYTGHKYHFAITADAADVPIKAWRARGKIYSGSTIEMKIEDNKFYPSCNLSGELNVSVDKLSTTPSAEYDTGLNSTVKFNGIVFENLLIKTSKEKNIDLSIGGFKYLNSDNAKIAMIPVAITRFEKQQQLGIPNNEIWLGVGFKISLLKDKIAGSSDLVFKAQYIDGRLQPAAVNLRSIHVEGSGTAFSAIGAVDLFEDNRDGLGKGFRGYLKMAVYKPFIFGVEVEALFGRISGNQPYSYGYFSAYAGAPGSGPGSIMKVDSKEGEKPIFGQSNENLGKNSAKKKVDENGLGFSIPTGLGDLSINGVGVAIYFNMKPKFAPNSVKIDYEPNYDVPFGIKATVGLQNSTASFVGNVALDFSLSRTHGINSIGIFGKGTFGVDNFEINIDKEGLGGVINSEGGTHSKEGLLASSSKMLAVKDLDNGGAASEIQISIGLMLDIPAKTAHLEAEAYVNIGELKGRGNNGKAGKMVLHFERNNNYFYLGRSPYSERVGLKYGNNLDLGVYVMAGKGLLPFPLPPPEVVQFFPSLRNRINTIDLSEAADSQIIKGFAVGAHINTAIDIGGWLGSIKGHATGGFDLMVSNGQLCAQEGWLGQAQLYAMAYVKAKVVRLTVFNGGVGVYLYGQGLKPFGASGDVCLQYGRKKKRLCASFKVGGGKC